MPDQSCGGCLDFDALHDCCRVRVDLGLPTTYLPVIASTPACLDYNTASTVQLPWFTRVGDKLARKSL